MLSMPEMKASRKFKFNDEWFMPRDRVNFYLTHDFHPYFAAFPPELVFRIIKHHTKPGDIMLDPFMGGGTSIVEGVVHNRIVLGSDVSPLSKLICETKSTPINIKERDVFKLLTNIKRSITMRNGKMTDPVKYSRITNVERWFDLDNLTELDSIYNCILRIDNKKYRNFAIVAFSSILRRSSNAKNAEQHLCMSKNKIKAAPFEIFSKKIQLMMKQMEVYYSHYGSHKSPKLFVKDVRKLDDIICENSVDVVVTSPPYGTGSKYTNVYKLNYEWLDLEKPKNHRSLEHSKNFKFELKNALDQIHLVLKPNKYCFFVYGDPSTDNGLTKQAVLDAEHIGFKHVGTISCPIKKTQGKRGTKYTQFIPKDFIIILQKQS